MSAIRHGIAIIVPHANGAPPQMTFRLDEATTKTTYHSCEWRGRLDDGYGWCLQTISRHNRINHRRRRFRNTNLMPMSNRLRRPGWLTFVNFKIWQPSSAPSTSNTDWLVSANLHRSALTPQPSRHRHKVSTGSASGVFYDVHTTQYAGGAHNLLARLSAGTQKCADMSKWRGAMVQYWADTGEVRQSIEFLLIVRWVNDCSSIMRIARRI